MPLKTILNTFQQQFYCFVHATFYNPVTTSSGRKVKRSEERFICGICTQQGQLVIGVAKGLRNLQEGLCDGREGYST